MIGAKDDQRVVPLTAFFQLGEDQADVVIDFGNHAVVAGHELAQVTLVLIVAAADGRADKGVRVVQLLWPPRGPGHVVWIIHRTIGLAVYVGRVRLDVAEAQDPALVATAARTDIVERPVGDIAAFAVLGCVMGREEAVEVLAGAFRRHVGAVDRAVVAQLVGIALLLEPGEIFIAIVLVVVDPLKAGQHIGVAQLDQAPVTRLQDRRVEGVVVVADQPGVVAGLAQGVGPILLRVAQRGEIVDRPRRAQIAAGVDAHPARAAGRGLVEAIAEMRPLAGQTVEIGRLDDLVAGDAETVGAKLVGENKEYIAGQARPPG